MIKEKKRTDLLSYLVLIIGCLFVIIPMIYMISTSTKPIQEIVGSQQPTLFPKSPNFEAFKTILTETPFLSYLKNSLINTLGSTVIAVIFSTLAGYGFSRFKFRSKNTLMMFILTTQMFPSVMLFVPYYKLLSVYGLSDTRLGIILIYVASVIPFCTWMMYGFFEGISKEIDEAAIMDGASRTRIFLQIIAPLTLPGLVSITIYAFIAGWNEYMFTMLFTTSEDMKTLTVAIGQMAGYDKINWNELMAASTLSAIPVMLIFVFLQKYFIASMTSGGVKG